ncbi:probable cytochrome P450 28c1 [Drosophila obscura]|uniref:probable cytochrome P450 28c1 n=1 Tax=Drosophila obscura TaxID=7282 RepID=UPI001BB1F379|nr:probable cytochrome P450 28c1 [Drosophila obscura]
MLHFVLVVLGLLLLILYKFATWNFGHWRRRNVREIRGLPLLGTFPNMVLLRRDFTLDINDLYMKYRKDHSYVGVFWLRSPKLLVLEPRLVHEVLTAGFRHFGDNNISKLVNWKNEKLTMCNPFSLKGQAWRKQRDIFNTLMTTARIRSAHNSMRRISEELCDFIQRNCRSGQPQDVGDLAVLFNSEVLLESVLGIRAGSFSDSPVVVKEINKEKSDSLCLTLCWALECLFPFLPNCLRPSIFPQSYKQFFTELTREAFRLARGRQNGKDFVSHLLALERDLELSEQELTSHAMTFMFDGLDTSSLTIAKCLFLLGQNPTCQQRLWLELRHAFPGKLPDLETLNELDYLTACVYESMRVNPSCGWILRSCTEEYTFHGSLHSTALKVYPGDHVLLPLHGLYSDPQFFSNPEQFRPERFLDGGYQRFKKMGVFAPFGLGPRQCVGIRLAWLQVRAAVASIVYRFVVRTKNTEVNPQSDAPWLCDFISRTPNWDDQADPL